MFKCRRTSPPSTSKPALPQQQQQQPPLPSATTFFLRLSRPAEAPAVLPADSGFCTTLALVRSAGMVFAHTWRGRSPTPPHLYFMNAARPLFTMKRSHDRDELHEAGARQALPILPKALPGRQQAVQARQCGCRERTCKSSPRAAAATTRTTVTQNHQTQQESAKSVMKMSSQMERAKSNIF